MSNPFSPDLLWQLADEFGTPLWAYDAATIRQCIAQLQAFDTVRFAQKACSNIHVLELMRAQGVKVDAVSRGEILRAIAAGFKPGFGEPAEIVFTADVMDEATLATVVEHQVPVNAGSIDMLHQLGAASPGHAVWLRINPGFGHGHSNKTNTGGEHSKHGIWHSDLTMALAVIAERGLVHHVGGVDDVGWFAKARSEACGQRAQDLAARDGVHLHALFAHQLEDVDIGAGLLREAHGVESLELGDALADGGGVIDPQRGAVLIGQGPELGGSEGIGHAAWMDWKNSARILPHWRLA